MNGLLLNGLVDKVTSTLLRKQWVFFSLGWVADFNINTVAYRKRLFIWRWKIGRVVHCIIYFEAASLHRKLRSIYIKRGSHLFWQYIIYLFKNYVLVYLYNSPIFQIYPLFNSKLKCNFFQSCSDSVYSKREYLTNKFCSNELCYWYCNKFHFIYLNLKFRWIILNCYLSINACQYQYVTCSWRK
jgi:hypothetical protein